MNARVFLLALVTAGFMAIWDADRPVNGRAAVAQSKLQHAGVPFANAVINSLPLVAAERSLASQDNAAVSDSASATATSEAVIPLPKNLQPGTWQAISRDGDTFRITIERCRSLTGRTSMDPLRSEDPGKRYFVITASDGIRWSFIKEHPKTAQQPSADQR